MKRLFFMLDYEKPDIFDYQTVFSARFNKQNEDGQMLVAIENFFNLKRNQTLFQFNIDNI